MTTVPVITKAPTPSMSSHERLDRIAAAMREHRPQQAERDGVFWEAAVVIVLRAALHGELEVLFIKRATREDDPWSGQIALPGGRFDPDDASLESTAVRETFEEVAIDLRRDGELLGALSELRPRTPVLPPVIVRPYVALLKSEVMLNPSDEIAELFWAPLDVILDARHTRNTEIHIRGMVINRDAIHYRGHVIWGMTEQILRDFAETIK